MNAALHANTKRQTRRRGGCERVVIILVIIVPRRFFLFSFSSYLARKRNGGARNFSLEDVSLSLSFFAPNEGSFARQKHRRRSLFSHSNAFVSIAEKRQRRVRLSSKISARVCSNSLSTDPKFVRKFLFFPLSFILQLSAHNFHRGLARANRRRAARSFQTQHTPGEDDDDEAEERRERICRDCLLLLPLYERVLLSFSLKMCCLLCVMTSNTILIFYR